ncbi:MAG: hypothetical protein H6607_12940 [Flavobacteriales bacterium]|nr:hypothetical protein [Flavobacteriales bacterium]
MELIDLVSELLYKHNCVIIPDFGGFVGNFKSTDFDQNRNLVSPTRKKVAFNQSLTENDGLLINALMSRKGIDYDQAEKEVYLFSKFLKDRILDYKNYEFKNVGSLYLNKEDKLIFVAYDGLNFYKKSYGLQDVKVKRLAKAVEIEKLQTQTAVLEVAEQPDSSNHEIRRIEPPDTRLPKRKGFIGKIYWPQVAASVALVLVFAAVLFQLIKTADLPQANHKNHQPTDSKASLVPSFDTETVVEPKNAEVAKVSESMDYIDVTDRVIEPKEQVKPKAEEPIVEKKIAAVEPVKPKVVEQSKQPTSTDKGIFYVVVGTNLSAAEKATKSSRLERKQYTVFEIEDKQTRYLCLEKFVSKQIAQEFLDLVKRYDDKSAFIYETSQK